MRPTDRRSVLAMAAALGAGGALPAAARPLDQVLSSRRLRAGINPTLPPLRHLQRPQPDRRIRRRHRA